MEEEAVKAIQDLVFFMKDVAPDVWAIMVKQQVIWGFLNVVILVVASLGFLWGVKITKTKPRWARDTYGEYLWGRVIMAAFCIILLIGVLVFCIEPRLLNPEYFAIMDLKP